MKHPPLVSVETRSHFSMNDSSYKTFWWYSDKAEIVPHDERREPNVPYSPEENPETGGSDASEKTPGKPDDSEKINIQKIRDKQRDLDKRLKENDLQEIAHFDDLRAVKRNRRALRSEQGQRAHDT